MLVVSAVEISIHRGQYRSDAVTSFPTARLALGSEFFLVQTSDLFACEAGIACCEYAKLHENKVLMSIPQLPVLVSQSKLEQPENFVSVLKGHYICSHCAAVSLRLG